MIYKRLTLDDITQLEFQCGKRGAYYIDNLLQAVKELSEQVEEIAGGGAGAGGVVIVHDVEGTLDKTWAEIAAAAETSVVMLATEEGTETSVKYLSGYSVEEGMYGVVFGGTFFSTDSPDGYPATEDSPK